MHPDKELGTSRGKHAGARSLGRDNWYVCLASTSLSSVRSVGNSEELCSPGSVAGVFREGLLDYSVSSIEIAERISEREDKPGQGKLDRIGAEAGQFPGGKCFNEFLL